jgi:hypothetical protein
MRGQDIELHLHFRARGSLADVTFINEENLACDLE